MKQISRIQRDECHVDDPLPYKYKTAYIQRILGCGFKFNMKRKRGANTLQEELQALVNRSCEQAGYNEKHRVVFYKRAVKNVALLHSMRYALTDIRLAACVSVPVKKARNFAYDIAGILKRECTKDEFYSFVHTELTIVIGNPPLSRGHLNIIN